MQQRWRRCHKLKYIEVEHLFSKRVSISIYSASGLRRTLNGARYHERESAKRPPGTLNETKCRENAEGLGAPHLDSRRDAVRVADYRIRLGYMHNLTYLGRIVVARSSLMFVSEAISGDSRLHDTTDTK